MKNIALNTFKFSFLALILIISSGCSSKPKSSAVYKQNELNKVSEGIAGTVLNKRNVKIKVAEGSDLAKSLEEKSDKADDAKAENPDAGSNDDEKVVGADLKLGGKEIPGFEYVVKLEDGKIINVTQSDDGSIEEDDDVFVFQYSNGHSRIVPKTKALYKRFSSA